MLEQRSSNVIFLTLDRLFTFILDTKTPDYYNNYDVLPGRNTQALLTRDFTILIARSIVTFLPAFKICEKLIPWHIEHQFTKEVTMASEVVSLNTGYSE